MSLNSKLQSTAVVVFALLLTLLLTVEGIVLQRHLAQLDQQHQQSLLQLLQQRQYQVRKLAEPTQAEALFNRLLQYYQYQDFRITIGNQEIFSTPAPSLTDQPLLESLLNTDIFALLMKHLHINQAQTIQHNSITILSRQAHSQLFNQLTQYLFFQLLALLVVLLLMVLLLRRIASTTLKQPLELMKEQLTQWASLDFEQPTAQFPTEWAPLATSMDQSRQTLGEELQHLKQVNSQLQRTAHDDPLTGMGNKLHFDEAMAKRLDGQQAPQQTQQKGVLFLIQASHLHHINRKSGYNAGDIYISKIAHCISQATERFPERQIFRLKSSEFAVILPALSNLDIEKFANDLRYKFQRFQQQLEVSSVAYCGIVVFESGQMYSTVMSQGDMAVSVAQTKQPNAWHMASTTQNSDEIMGSLDWQSTINNIIKHKQLKLFYQPVMPLTDEKRVYLELLSRFYVTGDHSLPTHSILAMAQRHEQSMTLDQMVTEMAISEINTGSLKGARIGIKISSLSVHNKSFATWLERLLLVSPELSKSLVFQLPTDGLLYDIETSQEFIKMLQRCGSSCTLEKFGHTLISFTLLKVLKPNYIKLDGQLIHEITDNREDRFYVRMLVDTAHQLRIRVIATQVETQQQKIELETLMIDAIQGHFIAKPASIRQYSGHISSF